MCGKNDGVRAATKECHNAAVPDFVWATSTRTNCPTSECGTGVKQKPLVTLLSSAAPMTGPPYQSFGKERKTVLTETLFVKICVRPEHGVERAADLWFGSLQVEEGRAPPLREALAARPALPQAARPVARPVGAVVEGVARLASAMGAAQGRRRIVDAVSWHGSRHRPHFAFLFSIPNVTRPLPRNLPLERRRVESAARRPSGTWRVYSLFGVRLRASERRASDKRRQAARPDGADAFPQNSRPKQGRPDSQPRRISQLRRSRVAPGVLGFLLVTLAARQFAIRETGTLSSADEAVRQVLQISILGPVSDESRECARIIYDDASYRARNCDSEAFELSFRKRRPVAE